MAAKRFSRLAALSCLFFAQVGLLAAQVSIPSTPAGETLKTWLDAFNSADKAKVEAYVKTVDTSETADGILSFRRQTGGFELLSIESSDLLHIRFRVKEKGGPTTALGNLMVKDGLPPMVVTIWTACAAAGGEARQCGAGRGRAEEND